MSDKLTFFEQNPVEHFRTLSKNILLSNKLTFASKKSRFCLTSQLEKQGKYKKNKKKTGRSFLPSMFIQKDFDIFKTRKYVIQNKSFLGQILVSLETQFGPKSVFDSKTSGRKTSIVIM